MKMTIRILGWLINLIALFLFLTLTTATLILMGDYAMIIFMLFLFLASKLPLAIRYSEVFARLREPEIFRKLAGEGLILLVAIIIRV